MKKHFFLLLSILVVLIIGIVVYMKLNTKLFDSENEASSEYITTFPTEVPSPIPTITPEPTVTVAPIKNAELFPAYQLSNQRRKYGYVNASGLFVIEPTFGIANDFHDGVAVVYLNEQNCAINEKGEIIYISSGALENFSNGMAVISQYSSEETLYGYIDTTGKVVIEPKFKRAYSFNDNNTAFVYQGAGVYSIIDKAGNILESYTLDEKYDNSWAMRDGYIIYSNRENNKYGVVDIKGNSIYEPIYSEITHLGAGIFAMKEPSLEYLDEITIAPAALYNYEGKQLTDYSLYDLTEFHEGYASATDDTTTFFIGTDGKKAAELPQFEGRGSLTLHGDYIRAELDNDLFYCMKNGSIFWKVDHNIYLSKDLTVKQEKFKKNRYILVYYPQVDGIKDAAVQASINEQLKSIFVDQRTFDMEGDEYLSVDDYFNASLIGNLLIIEKLGYDYYFGAAHGMPIMDYHYIDIRTGQFYQFADLFLEGSDYASKINELINIEITSRLEAEDSMLFEGSFQGIPEQPYYKLTEGSLIIYFYPYDISAYAAGFPEFNIPFADLEEYLVKDGDFWKAFH